jgi:hypothetical protein
MAIFDSRTEFCDAVSVAAAAGTALVGSQIDTSVVRDVGQGQPVYLVVNVDTEIITAGAAGTIQFKLASDATAVISTTTSSIHAISPEYVTDGTDANDAELKAGQYPWVIALPMEGEQYEQFLGILVVTGTTTTTAGAINAFLTLDPPRAGKGVDSYADATN